jgi:hypothetical protein
MQLQIITTEGRPQMIRLEKHDEIVEAMVEAARKHGGLRASVRAALDALLAAVVRL